MPKQLIGLVQTHHNLPSHFFFLQQESVNLRDACERGDLEEVNSLLRKCDVNAHNTDGESPLHIACKYGQLEIVKVLLMNQKCDLNTHRRKVHCLANCKRDLY